MSPTLTSDSQLNEPIKSSFGPYILQGNKHLVTKDKNLQIFAQTLKVNKNAKLAQHKETINETLTQLTDEDTIH